MEQDTLPALRGFSLRGESDIKCMNGANQDRSFSFSTYCYIKTETRPQEILQPWAVNPNPKALEVRKQCLPRKMHGVPGPRLSPHLLSLALQVKRNCRSKAKPGPAVHGPWKRAPEVK